MAEKLMALLTKDNEEIKERLEETKKQVEARRGNIHEISEDEIQNFREAQGVLYFLRAPALFQPKTCKHCGEHFLVSRLYVAYCSYTCIKKELNNDGLEWRKGNDIETLIADVYEGNEPIWVRNPQNLRKCLEKLSTLLSNDEESLNSTSLPASTSEPVSVGTTDLVKL